MGGGGGDGGLAGGGGEECCRVVGEIHGNHGCSMIRVGSWFVHIACFLAGNSKYTCRIL